MKSLDDAIDEIRELREYQEKMRLMDKFEKLSHKKKVDILMVALDYMQQYNGRSHSDCIILAMEGK